MFGNICLKIAMESCIFVLCLITFFTAANGLGSDEDNPLSDSFSVSNRKHFAFPSGNSDSLLTQNLNFGETRKTTAHNLNSNVNNQIQLYEVADAKNDQVQLRDFSHHSLNTKNVVQEPVVPVSANRKVPNPCSKCNGLTEQMPSALTKSDFVLKRTYRTRRQIRDNLEFARRNQPNSYSFSVPSATSPPPTNNGNYAEMLTKNRYNSQPLYVQPQAYPPKGFFPPEPIRPSFAVPTPQMGPNFVPQTTTFPPSFGVDLSESAAYVPDAFSERNRLFNRKLDAPPQLVVNSQIQMQPTPRYPSVDSVIVPNRISSPPTYVDRHVNAVPSVVTSNNVQRPPLIDSKIPQYTAMSSAAVAPSMSPVAAIDRFATDIGRFETGAGRPVNRVVLPDSVMYNLGASSGAPFRPANSMPPAVQTPSNPQFPGIVQQQQQPQVFSGYRPSPFGSNTGFPPTHTSAVQKPTIYLGKQPEVVQTRPESDRIGEDPTQPIRQRILTSDTENKFEAKTESNAAVFLNQPPTTTTTPPSSSTTDEFVTQFTTYPDYRQGLFPIPLNQARADNRPAKGGSRSQQMFGGGTNQYRSDDGRVSEALDREINNQKQWPSAVDDRRRPGYIDPLVQYGPPRAIENRPKGPYEGTSSASRPAGYMEGDDASSSDVVGSRAYGRTEAIFTTPLPWNEQTSTVVTVPAIDIESRLPFPGNQAARRTPEEQIRSRLSEDGRPSLQQGGIRPYFGPEEITRSFYKNNNPARDNALQHRFVKIDLPNSSTIS